MNRFKLVLLGVIAAVFFGLGLGWWLVPALVAPQLGMSLLEGVGLSTQVGDLGSFFLTLGSCIVLGLATGNKFWFYPPTLLIGLAASGRLVAWLAHGAALALDLIMVEAATTAVLVWASKAEAMNGRS
jgi:hypothetical protein